MALHSQFSPSSTYCLVRCPASASQFHDPLDHGDSPRTVEGDKTHALISAWLPKFPHEEYNGTTIDKQLDIFDKLVESVDNMDSGSTRESQDMTYGMQYFIRAVAEKLHQYWLKGWYVVDFASEVTLGNEVNGGTPDVVVVMHHPGESEYLCLVFDYKHGFGAIEADGGPIESCSYMKSQVLHYLTLCQDHYKHEFIEYGGWIVQPFGNQMRGEVRGGLIDASQLHSFAHLLNTSMMAAGADNPKRIVGGTQCYRCAGRVTCRNFQQVVSQLHQISGG